MTNNINETGCHVTNNIIPLKKIKYPVYKTFLSAVIVKQLLNGLIIYCSKWRFFNEFCC